MDTYVVMGVHLSHCQGWRSWFLTEGCLLKPGNTARSLPGGECGLDFYWDSTYKKEQIGAFERQICWARDRNLPLVIHMRKAEPELLDAMDRHKADGLRGIFHCFGGTAEEAEELLARFPCFVLGIGGVLTFKKSTLPETLKTKVPLSRIVLETDAPYLAPTPYRGKRNEPAYLPLVAQKLAEIYGVTVAEVAEVTTATALSVLPRLSVRA